MATPNDPRPLTRKELAAFLPTQRAIKAFERLFEFVPVDIESLETQTNIVGSKADQALATIDRLASALEQLASTLNREPLLQQQIISEPRFEHAHIYSVLTDTSNELIASGQPLQDFSLAAVATLTNAPVAGNPTKWCAVDDFGTTRLLPLW